MENKFGSKIILSIVIVFVFIAASIWFILNSPVIANNSLVIKTKNFYYLRLLPVWGFDQRDLTYIIFPIQKDSKYGYYTYSLLGKFEKFDFDNKLIYLKDKNNKTYAINYLVKTSANFPNLTFFTYQDWQNQKPVTDSNVVFDSDDPTVPTSPFTAGEIIEIRWEDFRTLKQILARGRKDSEILIERDLEPVLYNLPQVINRFLYEN